MGLTGYYRDYIGVKEEAFSNLKSLLRKEPILKLPHFNKQFILRTDASQEGIGAVMMQESNNQVFPVSYDRRKLRVAERNYCKVVKDLLALVEGFMRYYFYLYGDQFVFKPIICPLTI